MKRADVGRPGEAGVDLPAGKSADELAPADYEIVEFGGGTAERSEPEEAEKGRS
jgi:hypothetical protein